MRTAALIALADADVIVYLADAIGRPAPAPLDEAAGLSTSPRAPVVLALNKGPISSRRPARIVCQATVRRRQAGRATFSSRPPPATASTRCSRPSPRSLPESPFLYPADRCQHTVRAILCERAHRETAFEQLHQELPYSVAAQIEEFRESSPRVHSRRLSMSSATASRRILVGHKGTRIREIGRSARIKIEQLVGAPSTSIFASRCFRTGGVTRSPCADLAISPPGPGPASGSGSGQRASTYHAARYAVLASGI